MWEGVGTPDLEHGWPHATAALIHAGGRATLRAAVGSLPTDPAAVLATIGTGGTPSQHGITGTELRTEGGGVARAWSADAPESVITTVPDDLDNAYADGPRSGSSRPTRPIAG